MNGRNFLVIRGCLTLSKERMVNAWCLQDYIIRIRILVNIYIDRFILFQFVCTYAFKYIADKLNTCVIITTHSTGSFASIHDRMPVILDHAVISIWLDSRLDWSPPVIDLLKPFEGRLDL